MKKEFFKNCMLKVVEIVCPEKTLTFNNISFSNITITSRIEDIDKDISKQLQEKKFIVVFIALDLSTDLSSQLLIFGCGVRKIFKLSKNCYQWRKV